MFAWFSAFEGMNPTNMRARKVPCWWDYSAAITASLRGVRGETVRRDVFNGPAPTAFPMDDAAFWGGDMNREEWIKVEAAHVITDVGPFWKARVGFAPWAYSRDRARAVRFAVVDFLEGVCHSQSPES